MQTQKIEQLWSMSTEESLTSLGSVEKGLAEAEVEKRLKLYGKNTFKKNEKKGPVFLFFKQFLSPLIFLLLGAAIITGYLNEWTNTIVILFAVALAAHRTL